MRLLIDGYNLLHACGLFGRGSGPGGLHRSRMALLDFLADALPAVEAAQTIVVFDAAEAPKHLPNRFTHRGLHVWFSRGYPAADDLLEELIQRETAPRRLVVVSSDHRVQRAAQRRRATPIDSEPWYMGLVAARRRRAANGSPVAEELSPHVERPGSLSPEEVERWLRELGIDATEMSLDDDLTPEKKPKPPATAPPLPEAQRDERKHMRNQTTRTDHDHWDDLYEQIFPPGYAEDLEEAE